MANKESAKADVLQGTLDLMVLQTLIETAPETTITANVETGAITAGALKFTAALPDTLRDAFVSGQWNPTAMLLDKFDEVRTAAKHLPYVSGF